MIKLLQKQNGAVFYASQCTSYTYYKIQQDAQLSQRDRAARCVIVSAKSERLELGENILRD